MSDDETQVEEDVKSWINYDEGVDRLFPRCTRKYRLTRFVRQIFQKIENWWKYSVWSPREWKYRLKMKFWVKPNKVHVKYFKDHFWTDRCSLIRHCVMQILVDFVEKEHPFEHFDIEDSHHRKEWLELKSLYDWYKNFKEFDSFQYTENLLGYNPYERQVFQDCFAPIEKYGVNEWGEPNMYDWNHTCTPEETAAIFASLEEEKKWEQEFTDRAKRVIDLWEMLWT